MLERAFTGRGFGVLHGPAHCIELRFDAPVAHLTRGLCTSVKQWWSPRDGNPRVHRRMVARVAAWVARFGSASRACTPAELVSAIISLHETGGRGAWMRKR
jgi:hypothetical protein